MEKVPSPLSSCPIYENLRSCSPVPLLLITTITVYCKHLFPFTCGKTEVPTGATLLGSVKVCASHSWPSQEFRASHFCTLWALLPPDSDISGLGKSCESGNPWTQEGSTLAGLMVLCHYFHAIQNFLSTCLTLTICFGLCEVDTSVYRHPELLCRSPPQLSPTCPGPDRFYPTDAMSASVAEVLGQEKDNRLCAQPTPPSLFSSPSPSSARGTCL